MAQMLLLTPAGAAAGRDTRAGEASPVVCVVNTHLFGHPDATHVRLFQAACVMRRLEALAARIRAPARADGAPALAVVLCGDLNSQPEEAVRDLLVTGSVSAAHADWQRAAQFRLIARRAEREANWFATQNVAQHKASDAPAQQTRKPVGPTAATMAPESGKLRGAGWDYENMQEGGADLAIPLRQGMSLAQACAELPFTFFTAHSKQVVDYIYYSPWNLSPDPHLSPFPAISEESVAAHTAIPSEVFPSDHIALVQDLVWH